jgi:hypothetical protein
MLLPVADVLFVYMHFTDTVNTEHAVLTKKQEHCINSQSQLQNSKYMTWITQKIMKTFI